MKQLILGVLLCIVQAHAQTTIGLTHHSAGSLDNGYVLFAPLGSNSTYLIDKCGKQVHTWTSTYTPGLSCYLLSDGTLLRSGVIDNTTFNTGGKGGIVEKIDWNGNVTWSYTISDTAKCQHHDIRALPNGNVLIIAWEKKTNTDAIAQGRNPALVPAVVWSEQILEIQPVGTTGGNVVWEWHLWDHLVQDFDSTKSNYGVVSSNPQLVNANYLANATNSDWVHLNSIDYNAALDQILLCSPAMNEIWIIDHSTTTAQAASHAGGNSGKGGDILYRWGNPLVYNTGNSTQFFGQHSAHWIESGFPNENQIMVFNNGTGVKSSKYSTIEIITPPISGFTYNTSTLPYLPLTSKIVYNAGNIKKFYAINISGAQQLVNGNILFANGPSGILTEVDSSGNLLWNYVNPVAASGIMNQGATPAQNRVFRCIFYPSNYSAFAGRTLTADSTIENTNIISNACSLSTGLHENTRPESFQITPNPAHDFIVIRTGKLHVGNLNVELFDAAGQIVQQLFIPQGTTDIYVDTKLLCTGSYLIKVSGADINRTTNIFVEK